MKTYILLIRGINVGGNNTIPMKELKELLEKKGFNHVKTVLNSGNVIVQSDRDAKTIETGVERIIANTFKKGVVVIRVLAITPETLKDIVTLKPQNFGDSPKVYYSDVFFLIGVKSDDAILAFSEREGVDHVWQGEKVIYSQRLISAITKSHLNKVIGKPVYKDMTARSWNTVLRLLKILESEPYSLKF